MVVLVIFEGLLFWLVCVVDGVYGLKSWVNRIYIKNMGFVNLNILFIDSCESLFVLKMVVLINLLSGKC